MTDKQTYYIDLAKGLADLFGSTLHVALHRSTGHKVYEINRHYQGPKLKLAAGETRILQDSGLEIKACRLELDAQYYLMLLYDVSQFTQFQSFLNSLLSHQTSAAEPVMGQAYIDQLIENYCQEVGVSFAGLTNKDKRDLVFYLNQKEAFKYQDAANYLATKLNVSRATIYNYLKIASQFKSISIHQVDAFTDEPFSGNPAGVVFEADRLDPSLMKKIAREMNLSETAFVLDSDEADIQLRYFTPTGHEMKFCGHSTVSALYMLAHERMCGINKAGRYHLRIQTLIGPIHASVQLKKDNSIHIEFEAPSKKLIKTKYTHSDLCTRLGISGIDESVPIYFEPSNQDLYIKVNSLETLKSLTINTKQCKSFCEQEDIICLCFVSTETIQKNSDIHMRCFAPGVGIPEDPFTGSVLGGLAEFIQLNKLSNKNKLRIEQGHFINRPGYVDISIDDETVTIHAKARHFFSSVINL